MCFTENFWRLTVSGLTAGFIYALIAIGYTLVYGVLQLINFAHSEVFMMGAFVSLFVMQAFLGVSGSAHGFAVVALVALGLLAGAAGSGATAFGLELVAYRPLRRRGAPKLAFLISAIGASLFLFNFVGKEFGRDPIAFPGIFHDKTLFHIHGAPVSVSQVLIAVTAIVSMIALDLVVNKTRLGQGIRAVAQDADTAKLMGVNIDRVVSQTFVIGGILAGIAAFLYGVAFNVQFNMGFIPGIKAFSAAVLGGIGNIRGAMLGGLLLGLVENYTVACIGAQWIDVASFVVLVGVLLIRPTGILGERVGRSA